MYRAQSSALSAVYFSAVSVGKVLSIPASVRHERARLSEVTEGEGFGPAADAPEKGRGYHGVGRCVRISPDVAQQGVKSLNIDMTMEEVLKLRLALDSCLLSVNRYKRSTEQGKSAGVCLSVKTGNSSIAVIETVLRSRESPE